MNKHLPGPFTFILPATKEVNKHMLFMRKQIGIRVPDDEICRLLTRTLGNPIINTSVPLWGEKILNSGETIHDHFEKQIDLVLDIGLLVSEPSRIVNLTTEPYEIIRQGKGEIVL